MKVPEKNPPFISFVGLIVSDKTLLPHMFLRNAGQLYVTDHEM